MLEQAERDNLLVTGLIYIDTSRPTLLESFNLVETPLNRLADADLRPARETIEQLNATLF
jgi:2-oxoglutarate ferredoxin oxidoreductase subunit beta